MTPEEHCKRGDQLFTKKLPVDNLWQTLAEQFYPERADFTINRSAGAELADSLADSYPVLVRRDLGNSLSAVLRTGDWYEMGVFGVDKPDYWSKIWLQSRTKVLRNLMGDRRSGFTRSTKQTDHDYVTFGQGALSIEINRNYNGLLYRNWHLKDLAWWEDESGEVCGVYRKFSHEVHQLKRYFGDKCNRHIEEKFKKDPFQTHDMYHLVMPSWMYGDDRFMQFPYVSVYIDVHHKEIIEEVGIGHKFYVIPRFQTVAGSQYAYSPATVVALPDSRTLQAMTHTLLEAAERYTRPPIIATQKAIRSDIDLNPDGITWVDDEYDEKMGAALRPLAMDRGGYPIGDHQRERIVQVLKEAFYLDQLNMPDVSHEMTAYEVAERMKIYRRRNLPLFAPIEAEYSAQICEMSFNLALNAGFLGSVYDIPPGLMGGKVEFKFKSPLSESDEEKKINHFHQMAQMLAEAANYDGAVVHNVDFDGAFRDAIQGSGMPQHWLRSPEFVQQRRMIEQTVGAAEKVVQQ